MMHARATEKRAVVHVHAVATEEIPRVHRCPFCRKRRRFLLEIPANPYYSAAWTCCTCGTRLIDGENLGRSKDRAKEAMKRWMSARRVD